MDNLPLAMDDFLQSLNGYITRSGLKWLEPNYYVGIANYCSLVGYSSEVSPIAKAIKQPCWDDDEA